MKKDLKYYKAQLKESKAQIEILCRISEATTYNWDIEKILSAIVDNVSGYFKSNSCFIYLIDKKNLIMQASQNPHSDKIGKISLQVGEGLTGWVAQNKKPIIIHEKAYQDKRFKEFTNLPEDKFEAFLSMPIIFKDQIIGVINIQHLKKREYNKDRVKFLEAIASQVGGVIENARLISETSILKEALEAKKSIDKAKAILIKKYQMTEDAAHKMLHKKSMDKRISLKEVADAIILAEEFSV